MDIINIYLFFDYTIDVDLTASGCIDPHMGCVKNRRLWELSGRGQCIGSSAYWVETYATSCVGIMQWLTHTVKHTNCGPYYLAQTLTPWLLVWSRELKSPIVLSAKWKRLLYYLTGKAVRLINQQAHNKNQKQFSRISKFLNLCMWSYSIPSPVLV